MSRPKARSPVTEPRIPVSQRTSGAVEADDSTTLSAEVNSALRAEFTKRKRQQALADLLDHLAGERGNLDTPEDEAEIARYVRLLGGRAEEPEELRAGR
jgi:hypothetical protein